MDAACRDTRKLGNAFTLFRRENKRKYILAENAAYEVIMASWGLLDQRMSRVIFRKNYITALLVVWCTFLLIEGLWCVKSVVKERYCMGRRACLCHKFLF